MKGILDRTHTASSREEETEKMAECQGEGGKLKCRGIIKKDGRGRHSCGQQAHPHGQAKGQDAADEILP